MSRLVIEDGSIITGANCFVTVIEVDEWQSLRGSDNWPSPPDFGIDPNLSSKEAAILKATDYLNGLSWKGKRAAPGRVLTWPRYNVEDEDEFLLPSDIVPEAVKSASSYLAGLVYSGEEFQPILERGGHIQTSTIGKLSKTYFPTASVRDIASGLADLLRGLVYGLDAYAGAGSDASGVLTSVISLGQA